MKNTIKVYLPPFLYYEKQQNPLFTIINSVIGSFFCVYVGSFMKA